MGSPEGEYIHNLDSVRENNLAGQGFPAEDLTVDFFNAIGFDTRLSTASEDSGTRDIGPKQTIDAVTYYEGRPAMGVQITTTSFRDVREKKLNEMRARPFVRLDEMKPTDPAIPRVLIYLDAKDVKNFGSDPDFKHHPKIADQILSSCILSLQFDSSQTKNHGEK
ncbi:MAG: hypothetical protein EXS47_00460 [Candidatus Zambryskibacteria bacterium]|nr:hypothetical protein [Candidatus Zambryskibacteria bacterium]